MQFVRFLNYYGPQRFGLGLGAHTNMDASAALLRREWEKSFRYLETPKPNDDRNILIVS
jgi:tRNA(Glu) U13 pseudouridine synthase TruD